MFKFKFLFVFALGFALATGIGIYKQKRVANKANAQISTANTIISDLQEKQKELGVLKTQVHNLQLDKNNMQNIISQLEFQLFNYECPTPQTPQQPKKADGVFILPSSFEMTISNLTYNCKSK